MPDVSKDPVRVFIHPSQFPSAIEAALCESLRAREMNHKFHYDTPKQTLRWLRLHEAFSPARTDPQCGRIYNASFAECATRLAGQREIEVLSLGCGGGQKDAQLLRRLATALPDARLRYVPVDVSVGLALTARGEAIAAGLPPENVTPIVADLAQMQDWGGALPPGLPEIGARVVCFFGMLPNFLPGTALPQLANLMRPPDVLLVSANLAPGPDYAAGVARILPLYDNLPTRDWLWIVLLDLGLERNDGEMTFTVASCPMGSGLLRIEAGITFVRACRIECGGDIYDFARGEVFRVFYSCRHTPDRLAALLAAHRMKIEAHWTNDSGEEGVFLCGKSAQ